MDYEIGVSDTLKIKDIELSTLLTNVYVSGGFTQPDEAAILFKPSSVRRRGILIGAREKLDYTLAGIIIVVPPHSPALRLAKDNETEIHLLGVLPEHRQNGLGRTLVQTAINHAKEMKCEKIILWTQCSMKAAQKLYESSDFIHSDSFKKNNRDFKVYELQLKVTNK